MRPFPSLETRDLASVASLAGDFAAYARLLHPAKTRDGIEVRWDSIWPDVDERSDWHGLGGGDDGAANDQGWHFAPATGQIPSTILESLTQSVKAGEIIWCGYWTGWGRGHEPERGASTFVTKSREYALYRTDVSDKAGIRDSRISMIWPDDMDWFAITDIELNSTYVGGREPLVRRLVENSSIEAYLVQGHAQPISTYTALGN